VSRKKQKTPERKRSDDISGGGSKIVKSAGRVFRILELFDSIKSEATSVFVSRLTGIPQSSTSEMLHSLVALGYLDYDRRRRVYRPTGRVALLGNWVDASLVQDGPIISLMKEIGAATGENVVLLTSRDFQVQVLHVIPSPRYQERVISISWSDSIFETASGIVLLGIRSDQEVERLLWRYNGLRPGSKGRIERTALFAEIEAARLDGYVIKPSKPARDGWVVAMPLPATPGKPQLAVGVGDFSTTSAPRPAEILEITRRAIENWLGD
jgi:DNA-binding IclR family transcriptional regulator